MDAFVREPRYIVFKLKDILACGEATQGTIEEVGRLIAHSRDMEGKPPLNAVVVEQDWPEFEPVWAMIEARMSGRPAPYVPSGPLARILNDWKTGERNGDDCVVALMKHYASVPSIGGEPAVGWLIENGKKQGEGLAYRFMDNDAGGVIGWTEDVNKALRFARRADAEQFAHHDEDAWRIVEHSWRDTPGRSCFRMQS